jgi:hypothetical protein
MSQTQITKLNLNGINKDISSYELPHTVWSDGNNVQFDNDRTQKVLGHEQIFGTLSGAPYWLLYHNTIASDYWLYPTLNKIYKVHKSGSTNTHTDVTRTSGGDYSATTQYTWNGGILGGVAILNNGSDIPQMLGESPLVFQDLSNWPSGQTAKVIRPFKRFLVALDKTEAGTRYPFRVHWSHPAEGGTVPTSWDPADATKDSGYVDLSQTNGFVIDCLPLRDSNIIYKEDSVWSMNFEGGQNIFGFRQLFADAGILSRNCAQVFEGGHFVVSLDDVYVHDGQSRKSIVDTQIRDELFNYLHPTYKERTFVATDYKNNEMWVCFVSLDNETDAFVDKAFIWNWRNKTWSRRDLPNLSYIGWGTVDTTDSAAWTASGTWAAGTDPWNNPIRQQMLFADANNSKIYLQGSTNQFDTTDFRSWVSRENMSLGTSSTKQISKVVPIMSGTGPVNFYVGHKFVSADATTWKGPYVFTPGTHSEIKVRTTGNYVGIKVETEDTNTWKLDNLELHWKPVGDRGKGV